MTVSQTCTGAQLASEVPQLLWETIMRDNFMDMTLKGWLWYGTLHVCKGTRSLPLKVVLRPIPEQVACDYRRSTWATASTTSSKEL